jgi:hypothetical protein
LSSSRTKYTVQENDPRRNLEPTPPGRAERPKRRTTASALRQRMSRTFRMVATAARRPRMKVVDGHDRTAAAAPDGTTRTSATAATRTRCLTVSDRIRRWGSETSPARDGALPWFAAPCRATQQRPPGAADYRSLFSLRQRRAVRRTNFCLVARATVFELPLIARGGDGVPSHQLPRLTAR